MTIGLVVYDGIRNSSESIELIQLQKYVSSDINKDSFKDQCGLEPDKHEHDFTLRHFFELSMCIFFQMFVLYSLYAITKAFKRLCKRGVSGKEMRTEFFMKHLLYSVVIIITWYILSLNDLLYIFNY